jgi:hypothetical protein
MANAFQKGWALRWVEGSIVSYMQYRISLNILIGRIKKAVASYGVGKDEVLAIIGVIQDSPVYLPSLSHEEKACRLAPLLEALTAVSRGAGT